MKPVVSTEDWSGRRTSSPWWSILLGFSVVAGTLLFLGALLFYSIVLVAGEAHAPRSSAGDRP